jgi:thiosulfate dehydrogenase
MAKQKTRTPDQHVDQLMGVIRTLTRLVVFLLGMLLLFPVIWYYGDDIAALWQSATGPKPVIQADMPEEDNYWKAPDMSAITVAADKELVAYGKELVSHTAKYLGPRGDVARISNGMNCQNCHLDAGTKIFGNNYSAVAATYPKFRARSGTQEDIYKRVNDCFERSLNGQPLDTASREMQAIKAYILFLGKDVPKGEKPAGAGLIDLKYLDRAADPEKGKAVYAAKCVSCHQPEGQGQPGLDGKEYAYPPLWGPHSYNDGAGLYRVTNFARYVKVNMPQGATHKYAILTDEEAWDVAAFVNSQPRPHKDVPGDWPNIAKKPVDHPFGPYADSFSEAQHKYGPWGPIEAELKNLNEAQAKPDAKQP